MVMAHGPRSCAFTAALVLGAALSSSPPASGETPQTTHCSPSREQVCLTSSAGGRTTRVTDGQRVTLTLEASGQRWGEPILSGGAFVAVGAAKRSGNGWIADYRAVRPGTSTIRATEQPYCAEGVACPQYVLLWRAQLLVSG
jgi:hypothetical protein